MGSGGPLVLLLPGSRPGELRRHLPIIVEAARQMQAKQPLRFRLVLPNNALAEQARPFLARFAQVEIRTQGLAESLLEATIAIASTGTVTLECAYFGVPTVALYKTSWTTYQIAKRLITVNFLAMPNLLAGDTIYPEFIQHQATPENIARAALELLEDPARQDAIRAKLSKVVRMLGAPGASQRAADAIVNLVAKAPSAGHYSTPARPMAPLLINTSL